MSYVQYIQWPLALPLVILLPLLTGWLLRRGLRARAQRLARLGTPSMVARLAPSLMSHRPWTRILRVSLAALLLAAAFAGPRWGIEQTVIKQEGVDVVLALDASSSMLAADERPSRLAAMKREINRLR
ncbi:MAG TPA: hypothetical protein VNO75_02365, partial [Gemmatimonadaceae bacterium]|nr:hypothetical protein [Gemmatimonadaceae bacterium]